MIIELNLFHTTALAVVVLFIGQWIRNRVYVLQRFSIPTPVVGGLLFTTITLIGHQTQAFEINLDFTLSDVFMLLFYSSIGFTAQLSILKRGGKKVLIFLLLSSILVVLQNMVGVGGAMLIGEHPLVGIATASIPMTGGHGTSAAFAPDLIKAGFENATTVTLAAATFGLVSGALVGGPIGEFLIGQSKKTGNASAKIDIFDFNEIFSNPLSTKGFTKATYILFLTCSLGTIISELLKLTGMTFPASVGGMLASALIVNLGGEENKFKLPHSEIQLIGNVSLSIFLAYSMMKLKLWEIADLAGPMIILLSFQVILMVVFAIFIDYRFLGKDYEAAVTTSGHCGFGLGAVPTGMANMQTLQEKHGPAPQSFFIVPLVGSLFINLVNSVIIAFFINAFKIV